MISYRQSDFNNILSVLKRQRPQRPTLFEFFLNTPLFERLLNRDTPKGDSLEVLKFTIDGFRTAGYDYATTGACDMHFPSGRKQQHLKSSISINEGAVISDEETFEKYVWPEPENYDYSKSRYRFNFNANRSIN